MVIPLHNTQGEPGPEQMRPHHPKPGKDGKTAKYLFAKGAEMIVDVHPRSQPLVRDVRVPAIITESTLKGDAILSNIEPGTFCVVSIAGVDTWRSDDMPLPDWLDLPMKIKDRQSKRVTFRRPVYIAHDSDTATKDGPKRARWELGQFQKRRGADVWFIDVPDAADGSKQGIDDALASGHTMADLLASAYRMPHIPPMFDATELPDDATEIERLRAENRWLRHDRAMLLAMNTNPYIKQSRKEFMAMSYVVASQKTPDAEGYVEIEAGEISGDWREETDDKGPAPKLNPDGSRPLMARSSVKTAARELMEMGVFDATELPKSERRKGRSSTKFVWRIKQPKNMAEYLAGVATFELPGIAPRKNRTQSPVCPGCNERHPIQIDKTCMGCGTIIDTKTVEPVELTPDDVEQEVQERRTEQDAIARLASSRPNNLSGVTLGADKTPLSPALSPNVTPDKLFGHSPETETLSADSLPSYAAIPDGICTCGGPLPPGHKWSCADDCDGTPRMTGRLSA